MATLYWCTWVSVLLHGGMRHTASRWSLRAAAPQGLLDADGSLAAGLARTRYLVLDEADRLLEPSFEPELRAILSVLPAARQTLLFSATMTRSLVALQSTNFADAFYFEVCRPRRIAGQLAPSTDVW